MNSIQKGISNDEPSKRLSLDWRAIGLEIESVILSQGSADPTL